MIDSGRSEHDDRRRNILALLVFLIALAAYVATLPETILPGDSGELITSSQTMSIAHPPVYPLYLLATKTHDRDKKKELLMLSYRKLKALIEKYPLSPLIKKIKENADRVNKSLEQLESSNERYP